MDITQITQIVSSVGFPIFCCIYLINNIQKMTENHKNELDKMATAIDNNTKAMTKLCNKIGVNLDD